MIADVPKKAKLWWSYCFTCRHREVGLSHDEIMKRWKQHSRRTGHKDHYIAPQTDNDPLTYAVEKP